MQPETQVPVAPTAFSQYLNLYLKVLFRGENVFLGLGQENRRSLAVASSQTKRA